MPGLFGRYPQIFPNRNSTLYKEPERFTSSEARQRRLFAELAQQRKALEARAPRLSPANISHLQRLKEFETKFGAALDERRRRVERAAKRNPSIVRSPSYIAAMSKLLQLERRRNDLLERAAAERRKKGREARAVDSRFYNPDRMARMWPRTDFGTDAWLKWNVKGALRQVVRNPFLALPCVDRMVRREVMFAKKKAGKGYRKPHRRGPLSNIGC